MTAFIWAPKGLSPLTDPFAALRLRAAGQLAVLRLIFFAFQRCVSAAARADWICGLVHSFATPGQPLLRKLRPFTTRSDTKLLSFTFRSEKWMVLFMHSDFAKSDGIKSDLRIRWPKSSYFGPK